MADYNRYHNGNMSPNGFSNGTSGELNHASNTEKKDSDEIDLKEVAFILWTKKWLIGGAVILCGLLGYIIAATMTPIYQSEGSILITDTGAQLGGGEGLAGMMSSAFGIGGGSSIDNALLILKSRSVSQTVADSLLEERLMKNGRQFPVLYNSYPDDSTLALQDTVASRLSERLAFYIINPDADLIRIAYESPSPLAAAHVVNTTMNIYTDLSMQRKRTSASAAVEFLKQERGRIQDSLYQAEEELRGFMNTTGVIQVETQTASLIQQLATLEAELYTAQAKLEAATSGIVKYEERLNNIKPGLADQFASATASNMELLQIQLAELEFRKTRLLAQNPGLEEQNPVPDELRTLNRKIGEYQQNIRNLTQELVDKGDQYLSFLVPGMVSESIAEINQNLIELRVLRQQYEAQTDILSEQIVRMEGFFQDLPDNIIALARLKREVMLNEKIFATITQQYAEMSLLEQTQFGLGRTIDTGYVPHNPVSPNTLLFILIGFIIGGIGSIGYVFTKEAFNTTIDGVEKMKKQGVPLLSVIPQMNDHTKEHHNGKEKVTIQGKEISTKLVTVLDSISPIAESFRRLQSNLIYSNPDSKMKSIMLTSAGKGAGKTTTISNLGVVLAEAGYKTVIVETDLRRANVHNVFGISRTPGFMEVLFDDLPVKDALKDTIAPGLSILTAGRRPPNPSAVTQSKAFLQAIKDLERSFDFVLIDTPPFGIITDSSALINQVDGVVVAARFNKTTEVQLDHTMEELHRIKAPVLGTVLTAFDYRKSSDVRYSSSYYKEAYKEYNEYEEEGV